MSALPASVNYADSPMGLPDDVVSKQLSLTPVNGGSFVPGGIIQFDFVNSGYIVPESIYLRYKYTFTNLVGAEMTGCPVYSPFSRMEVLIGSNVVESQSQYSQTCCMNTQLQLDLAQKFGQQYSYGYLNSTTAAPTLDTAGDGRTLIVNEVGTFSAPVPCILSSASKLIPAGFMPNIRLQLTMDSLANYFNASAVAVPTALTLTNVELCYTSITSATFDAAVRSMGSTLSIKSMSYFNSASVLSTGSAGQIALTYNQRLASIRAAFILFTGTSANSLNKQFDAYDPTSNNGDVSISIAGVQYPQRPLSFLNNKAGILQSLRSAVGSIYDRANAMSISAVEFAYVGNGLTTIAAPAKMICGVPLERIHSGLMSGVSSQNSSISVNLNTGTATAQTHNVNLILAADVIMVIDTAAGQVSVRQ
jgi:hypothetical protein